MPEIEVPLEYVFYFAALTFAAGVAVGVFFAWRSEKKLLREVEHIGRRLVLFAASKFNETTITPVTVNVNKDGYKTDKFENLASPEELLKIKKYMERIPSTVDRQRDKAGRFAKKDE